MIDNDDKRTALLKSYVMWAWLEETGNNRKQNYPLYDELRFHDDVHFCPLCTLYDDGFSCEGCPIDDAGENCKEHDSNFDNWISALKGSNLIKLSAGEIAAILRDAYKEVEEK